jgi:adenylyl-sulfate kinase
MDIKEFLDQDQKKDLLRLLTAGSVDDGKSTMIGRLLFDSKKIYEDQLDALHRDSKRVGHAGENIDYALLLDGLKAEREQGITIDVAYRYFSTAKRKFIIADTPGHEQYTRNMVTGASTANLAIILIDARQGVITQTKRHTFIVSLLGIKHVVVAVNKMDLVDYDKAVFDKICQDYREFVTQLDLPDITFIPISALFGDNVVEITDKMPWYHGESMLEYLENVHISSDRNFEDLRYPVQYVLRPSLDFRGFSANVASGVIRKGDTVMALPSRKTSTVERILAFDEESEYAFPPEAVTVTLKDEIDISKGDMIVHPKNLPIIDRHIEAHLVWMDEVPMDTNKQFFIKQTTNTTKARLDAVQYKIDVNTLAKSEADHLKLNEIGRVVLTTNKPLFFDPYRKNRQTGAFVLMDPVTNNTSAVGMIIQRFTGKDIHVHITGTDKEKIVKGESLIKANERQKRYNQKGVTLWITGLHGSGKNELAYALERQLFDRGATVALLDGKSTRQGLSRELDYSPNDRAEHLRRVAHIAKLLNEQGIITICSFISPDDDIREQIREIIGEKNFYLIYQKADLVFCRKNDEYGLYEMADKGDLKYLPGIDMDYDVPEKPVLELVPSKKEQNPQTVMNYLLTHKIFPLE